MELGGGAAEGGTLGSKEQSGHLEMVILQGGGSSRAGSDSRVQRGSE